MKDYVSIVYDEDRRPKTDYPLQLAEYLFRRFGMKVGDKILDNGCGRGDFLEGFNTLKLDGCGTDLSESAVNNADLNISKVDLEQDRLPFDDNYFEYVFSKSVLEHLDNPDNYMKEIYRVLKPNGVVILMVPDWHSQIYIYYDDHTHRQPYTKLAVADLLNIYNFKDSSSELFYQLPLLWKVPWLKVISKILQLTGPVKKLHTNKFYRWSLELMILGHGRK